jgi:hypothetical protein
MYPRSDRGCCPFAVWLVNQVKMVAVKREHFDGVAALDDSLDRVGPRFDDAGLANVRACFFGPKFNIVALFGNVSVIHKSEVAPKRAGVKAAWVVDRPPWEIL